MSNYLVTGGAGFIGSNIAAHLVKEGHFVRVLDNFSAGKEENLDFGEGLGKDKFELIRGDIRDKDACRKTCRGMDYVLHQAAIRSVPKSLKMPEVFNDVNINGILAMLQAAKKENIKRFVFASSSSIYGERDTFPERETDLPMLRSPYALTKLSGEYYCRVFSELYGLQTVALRYFNVFGPRQPVDDSYALVIPKFIHCILNGQPPPVYGTGEQSRDFTYIENVIWANQLAATTPGIKHEVFNVALGETHTINELVDVLNEVLGKEVKAEYLPLRGGDIYKTHADISKIKELIKYQPKVFFREGVEKTAQWFKDAMNESPELLTPWLPSGKS